MADFGSSREAVEASPSWQCIFDMLDARSLARCVQTCTTFRDYAREIFERKATRAFYDLSSFMTSQHYDQQTMEYISFDDLISQFGEWCPERYAEVMMSYEQISEHKNESLIAHIWLFHQKQGHLLLAAINQSRGTRILLRIMLDLIRKLREINIDCIPQDKKNEFLTLNAAVFIADYLTEQNANLVLIWLENLPDNNMLTVFSPSINAALISKNAILLKKIILAVASSSRCKQNFSLPNEMRVARAVCQNALTLQKCREFISLESILNFFCETIGANKCEKIKILFAADDSLLSSTGGVEASPSLSEYAIYCALQMWDTVFADWLVGNIPSLRDFHSRHLKDVTQRFYRLMPKDRTMRAGWIWIFRNAKFSDEKSALHEAMSIQYLNTEIGFINGFILFACEHNLFAYPEFTQYIRNRCQYY
ncbi:MAG: hypothetical protein M0R33_18930 [Methylomonas sp.]|jgi:hypothetical protein|uniref:hypothetical protein n=1 Tax=Methylomonas sp. TaxID=418 RepID=UPI0025E6EAF5|nr:hypothetical protein [Methylomonas sp.]MCK9608520.1 hypothetical protein [Methylomonas sp.]